MPDISGFSILCFQEVPDQLLASPTATEIGCDPDRLDVTGGREIFFIFVGIWELGGRDTDNFSLAFRYYPC